MYRYAVARYLPVCRWLLLFVVLGLASPARGEEFYYLLMFSSQHAPPCIAYSHTFATFVKATGHGPCANHYQLEAHTISWMPQTLVIRPYALLPECGQNQDLYATFHWALATEQRVSLWGPFQIDRDLYERALCQIRALESGQVRYKAVTTGILGDQVSNCIHAVSDIAGPPYLLVLNPSFGETASYHVLLGFEPWIRNPCCRHFWVSDRMGLRAYPLLYRDWEHPCSGLLWGPISSVLGTRPWP
jgi:hypothetical protein